MNAIDWECYNNDNIGVLKTLYKNSGSCVMNGYLGDSISEFSLDENGNLEFSSKKSNGDNVTLSKGTILSDSVLIKQSENQKDRTHYQLFSWDVPRNQYSYILFSDETSLNDCYNKLKNNDICLCGSDVSSIFNKYDISFDNISQILLDQKVDSVDAMFEDAQEDFVGKTSFTI
jgi:hypothetical protein